jgi:uncharacterized protein
MVFLCNLPVLPLPFDRTGSRLRRSSGRHRQRVPAFNSAGIRPARAPPTPRTTGAFGAACVYVDALPDLGGSTALKKPQNLECESVQQTFTTLLAACHGASNNDAHIYGLATSLSMQKLTMTKTILFTALLAIAVVPRAFGASFDCSKATNLTEMLICKDHETSSLDEQLQHTYQTALTTAAPSSKNALIKEQRNWIAYTRNVCEDEACLRQAYSSRINLLATNQKYILNPSACSIPDGSSCRSVVSYRDPNARIDSFNRSLAAQKKNGKIIGCSKLIDLPVGNAGSNDSFGGICIWQDGTKRTQVEICNDDMIGHFAVRAVDLKSISERGLIDFTNDQCFGG